MNPYSFIAAHGYSVKDTDPALVILSLIIGALFFALFLYPTKSKDE